MKRLIAAALLLLVASATGWGQKAEDQFLGQGYIFFGRGTGTSNWAPSPSIEHFGAGGEGFLYEGLGFGGEAGQAWWGGPDNHAWVGAVGFSYHFGRHAPRGHVDPFLLGGFSMVGPTEKGNGRGAPAGNYGGGVNVWLAKHTGLRLEFRDVAGATQYWPYSHYVSFRFGVTFR